MNNKKHLISGFKMVRAELGTAKYMDAEYCEILFKVKEIKAICELAISAVEEKDEALAKKLREIYEDY